MKPSFALDFRDGLVTLLHRTSRGWSQVGATSFDAPDLDEALGYLRSTALGLSPRGITTKLILPNDQILYHQAYAPGPEPAKRKRQIRAALEGLTPYGMDDLVYDWWGTGAELQVAVVAKETLAEAEAFATEHRFNPVSFVGVPENGAFLGEPFFGPTAAAATLLAEGEKVERDPDPVTVIARDFPRSEPVAPPPRRAPDAALENVAAPSGDPEPAERFAPVPLPPRTPVAEAKPAIDPTPVSAPRSDAASWPAGPFDSGPLDAAPVKGEPEPSRPSVADQVPQRPFPPSGTLPTTPPVARSASSTDMDSATVRNPEPPLRPAPSVPSWPLERALPNQPDRQVAEPKPADPKPAEPKVEMPVSEAPMAMDVAPEPIDKDDDIPPSPAAEIVAAFASRRTAAIAAATAGTTKASAAPPVSKAPSVGPAPSGPRPTVPRPSMARPAAGIGTRETVPFPMRSSTAPTGASSGAQTTGPRPAINKSGKPGGALVTAPGILGARRERNVVPLPTAASPEAQEAAARRSTAKPGFGLGSKDVPVKGKPKYLGLILTGILLLLLAAVAAWSSFFMGTNDSTGAGMPPAATSSALVTPTAAQQTTVPATTEANPAGATTAQDSPTPAVVPSVTMGSAVATDGTAPKAADTQATADQPAAVVGQGSTDQAGTAQAGTAQAGTAQAGTAQAGTAQATGDQTATALAMAAPEAAVVPDAAGDTSSAAASVATDGAAAPTVMAANAPTAATMSTPALPGASSDAAGTVAAPGAAAAPTSAPDAAVAPSAPPPVAAPEVAKVEPAPKTEVSTAGIVAALPPSTPQDTIVVASADSPPKTPGRLALPAIKASADASPAAEPAPPPFGTVYKFDAEGRIIPTAQGIITPEGVLLVAGKPKVLPPQRPANLTGPAPVVTAPTDTSATAATPTDTSPATVTPTAADAAIAAITAPTAAANPATAVAAPAGSPAPAANTAAAVAAPAASPASAVAATPTASAAPATEAIPASLPQDPTLRGKHPKNRPADLPAPLPQAQKQQGALPDTNADQTTASLRPQARPDSLPSSPIAADTGADVSAASASLAANGFALTSSPKPPARPASLKMAVSKTNSKGAVDKAVDVAINQPVADPAPAKQPAQQAVQVASNTVADGQDEPDIETNAPTMPTNASVAKQATTRHALSSSKVALLAVFGSPSTRFAMVRQANGAVKKVQVGDNVDGGRIGAITDNSVQYSKGGQILTLSLPTG